MLPHPQLVGWATALGAALVLTPVVRALALRFQIYDRPGAHKSHAVPVPYLGGVAVITATLLATAVSGYFSGAWAVGLVLGAALGVVGLIDDLHPLHAFPRFAAQLVVAVATTAAGLRLTATGVPVLDMVCTVVWVLAIINAVNFIDNMDGLAGGITMIASFAVAAIAFDSAQPAIAVVALCLAGAAMGFLPYNAPRASIYLGDTGSQFLGLVLALLTVEIHPAAGLASRAALPFLLLALPVLDICSVVVARTRRGISVTQGGRNHLSHRLVALGMSRPAAVSVLLLVEAAVSSLGVATARGDVRCSLAVIGAVIVLGGLALYTSRADVFDEPLRPSRVRQMQSRAARQVPLPRMPEGQARGAEDNHQATEHPTVAPRRNSASIQELRRR